MTTSTKDSNNSITKKIQNSIKIFANAIHTEQQPINNIINHNIDIKRIMDAIKKKIPKFILYIIKFLDDAYFGNFHIVYNIFLSLILLFYVISVTYLFYYKIFKKYNFRSLFIEIYE